MPPETRLPSSPSFCRLCGGEWRPWIEKPPHRMFRCCSCGYGALDPLPEAAALKALYDRHYFEDGGAGYPAYLDEEPVHRLQARRNLRILRRFVAPERSRPRLLDVGCAAGFFLDEARRQGWEPHGVELNPEMCAHARRLSLAVEQVDFLEAALEPGSFDAVSFFGVLSHLHDPSAALDQARRCLRPGGVVMIEAKDAGSAVARLLGSWWFEMSPPSVCHYFSRKSLERLLRSCGFHPETARARIKLLSRDHVLSLLAEKYPGGRPAARLLRRLVPRTLPLAYGLGDIVLVVARAGGSDLPK